MSARHPIVTSWPQIARVLGPGGTFLSQQVGTGSVRELTEAMMGPYKIGNQRAPATARSRAKTAGLDVLRSETASLPMQFHDIAAVVVFLQKVIWIVPDFTVDAFRPNCAVSTTRSNSRAPSPPATSERFLIECQRPT